MAAIAYALTEDPARQGTQSASSADACWQRSASFLAADHYEQDWNLPLKAGEADYIGCIAPPAIFAQVPAGT